MNINQNSIRIGVLCTVAWVLPTMLVAQRPNGGGGGSQGGSQGGAQGSEQPGQGGGGLTGATNGTSGSNDPSGQTMRDKAFLKKAAEGGMAEIQLGKLAAQKGSSDEVKQFGQKMVDDHTTLNDSMKPIADTMGVRPPTKLSKGDQVEYDKLNGLSGDDFDKEYLAYMVKDHHKDLRDFRAEDATVTDSSLKPAVDKGLQVIQEHTEMVDKLAKSKGISK